MAKLSVEERLDVAIKQAATDAAPEQSSRQVAEDFYDSEPKLIEHFTRDWVTEKLTALIRLHRAKTKAEDDPQMQLGFSVPRKVILKSGAAVPFGEATLRKIRQYRALVWKQKRNYKHPTVVKLDKAIELMKPYATGQRGITYAEAAALEAEKVKQSPPR